MKNKIIILAVVLLLFGRGAGAAQVSFDVAKSTVSVGDSLLVRVSIDTQGGIFATSLDIDAVILELGIGGRF